MHKFRVGEQVRIVDVGTAHRSWLGMEGDVIQSGIDYAHVRFMLLDGTSTTLPWPLETLESVDSDYARAVLVLGEGYFA